MPATDSSSSPQLVRSSSFGLPPTSSPSFSLFCRLSPLFRFNPPQIRKRERIWDSNRLLPIVGEQIGDLHWMVAAWHSNGSEWSIRVPRGDHPMKVAAWLPNYGEQTIWFLQFQ